MKPRYLLGAAAAMLLAGAANAQSFYPATYQEPYCREFTKVVDIGGRAQPAYGQACLQPDGSWQIVSDDIPAAQPVQYYPAPNQVVYVPRPTTTSFFTLSLNSFSPYRGHRYYNHYDRGGWRDNRHTGWSRGDGHHSGNWRDNGHQRSGNQSAQWNGRNGNHSGNHRGRH